VGTAVLDDADYAIEPRDTEVDVFSRNAAQAAFFDLVLAAD